MSADLIAARKAAIARGDKALGRELYHQLVDAGYTPESIDADTFTDSGVVLAVDTAPAAEVAVPDEPEAPETTQAPEAPEKAVKPAPRRRKPKDDE